jgi:hypothetical protein
MYGSRRSVVKRSQTRDPAPDVMAIDLVIVAKAAAKRWLLVRDDEDRYRAPLPAASS